MSDILKLLGDREEIAGNATERIQYRYRYNKALKAIRKIEGVKSIKVLPDSSNTVRFFETPNGKKAVWYINSGYDGRSRFCGTLYLDGHCIFTSGSIERALKIIAEN